jgi:aminoglycoside phosphotransferase family enzyme
MDPPGCVETHSATVLFAGDPAYKWKKPVDLGFLDFRTVEARRDACRRELELNRRLCPDVYLDVAEMRDGTGRTREWVLAMRRMPAARRLSTLVRQGEDVRDALRRWPAAWPPSTPRYIPTFGSPPDFWPDEAQKHAAEARSTRGRTRRSAGSRPAPPPAPLTLSHTGRRARRRFPPRRL